MPSKSLNQQEFFKKVRHAKHDPDYGSAYVRKVANSMSDSDIDDFANSLSELKTKKAVLSILKDIREPMYLDEVGEESTSIDPVSTTFHVKEEWATYIKPYIGQPFSPRELAALDNFKEKKPTTTARTEIWYKTTDPFGTSHVTVIKKMKDSGQFSFTAFQKHDRPISDEEKKKKEQEKQMATGLGGTEAGLGSAGGLGGPPTFPQGAVPPGSPIPPAAEPEQQEKEEEKEDIIVTKSILFKDDIKGAAILVEFLKKLDL
jgi:hypothetical protein